MATAQRELEAQTQQLQIAREAFNDALAEARLAREENVVLRGDLERLRRQYEGSRQDLSAERDQLQRRSGIEFSRPQHEACGALSSIIANLICDAVLQTRRMRKLKFSDRCSEKTEPGIGKPCFHFEGTDADIASH